jgi:hypothetical protein
MAYTLGNVKPWVAAAANEVGPKFGIRTIYGYSYRTIDGGSVLSDHALGLALDFMCDIPTGDKLATYVQANASRLSVTYIIHNRRIWNISRQSEGWRVYTGRNPHTDHVHVSFQSKSGSGTPSNPTGGSTAQNVGHIPLPIPGGGSIPLPHLPGSDSVGGDIAGGAGAVKGLYDAMKGISDALEFLINPNSWKRAGMFLIGLALLGLAITMLIKNQKSVIRAAETVGNVARNTKAPTKISTRPLANGNEAITSVTKGTRTIYKG